MWSVESSNVVFSSSFLIFFYSYGQRVEGTETDLNTALALSASLQEAIEKSAPQPGSSRDDCFVVPDPPSAITMLKPEQSETAGVSTRRRGGKQANKT